MEDSKTKRIFIIQIVSSFRYDKGNSIERFSEIEGQLVDRFLENFWALK